MFPSIEIYTVSQLTSGIKHAINSQFRDIFVEGEVSNAKLYPSGHLYFTLKDSNAMLKAVFFGYAKRYPVDIVKDGAAVICRGRVDVYEKRGEYQLITDMVEVKGLGLLQLKFQMLKEKLFKEGLFLPEKKKSIPILPQRIGIVTSPAGAAIRDMLKIIYGKFDNMTVEIYPVKVQGDDACFEIVDGIDYFNKSNEVDIIILGRGGGSLEDLAPFNEEMVARAIYASKIPVITGVGHEIDFTIADFVADVRAPTPTAAADIAVRNKLEFLEMFENTKNALRQSMKKKIEKSKLMLYENVMELKGKKDIFTSYRMYLDELLNNLLHGFSNYFKSQQTRLDNITQRLIDLNPEGILKRGYSITMKRGLGIIVTDASQVSPGEELSITLSSGRLEATVDAIANNDKAER
ncbi:MAG: exodeoxyribonuclease VII large subunit [Syntrophorhabdaceae bacterium]|jgi:exodeoxyribonuclease VII large subunit|nr:exodeoxyribonuclease VII large subunit [Syntrophorhabdaceae bacterium]MDI9561589.1 exodeoxyribonuclease VII large subunit [Pseudomonadota bacterium]